MFAVVLAGGTGKRMGGPVPKQLLEVRGKPVLGHTLEAFEAAPEVDRILVVMAEGYGDQARRIANEAGVTKLADVIGGGASRSDSSLAALSWIGSHVAPGEDCKVLLHDAARMLVTGEIIAEVAGALDECDAVTVAVPASDTVIEVHGDSGMETIAAVPDRSRLRRVQTPQGFRFSVIRAAYAAAEAEPGFTATDDCSVVLRFLPQVPVRVVPGDERNLKVTEPTDLAVAEALLER
ncbi:2-C-methyl-D-erythritol 4-phosphate cytidylyltransferase [Glycomyces buryatensis]|uniref:2-C-methyl-D-erythritol 4-phosphate cytidylyltransferase n=1 Tax=Glycomyces buryatensis TaxID=2570927 RepID=A0A4S8QFN7_9ACTN|nr:2-C-methyl-D-erythritol 4-phosphate cytidylyltransferase [Glycomyces buryatensis]